MADVRRTPERLARRLAAREEAQRPIPEPSPTGEHARLCVAMATYEDYDGVYFTIQSLRISQPEVLGDTTFLLIDNHPEGAAAATLRDLADKVPRLRYVPFRGYRSTAIRDLLFREADADVVLCLDSHVLVRPGGLGALLDYFSERPESRDIVQGPLLDDALDGIVGTHFAPLWGGGMYGQWDIDERINAPDPQPFEIPMQGLGLFACRREAWPGINPRFRGFGGEEGYLQEKFRRQGGRAICLPELGWTHRFSRPAGVPYDAGWQDRMRNYHLGWSEIGWDTASVDQHFREHLGAGAADEVLAQIRLELENPLMAFHAIFWLSTDTDAERWEQMHERFASLEIEWRVERFPAVPDQDAKRGRLLSFRSMIKTARRRGYASVLIVEDGVDFIDEALIVLSDALLDIDRRPWDVLCLSGDECVTGVTRDSRVQVTDGPIRAGALAVNGRAYDRILSELPAEPGPESDDVLHRFVDLEGYLRDRVAAGALEAPITFPSVIRDPATVPEGDDEPAAGTASTERVDDSENSRVPLEAEVVLFLRGFGVSISVSDMTSAAIADRLAAAMPPELIDSLDGPVQLDYVVDVTEDGGMSVARDGSVEYAAATGEEIVSWLRADIDSEMAFRASEAIFVHAGVVAWRGRAILIPGRSGTGKSSLVTELVRRGAVYYSDDLAPIDEHGFVHAYARLPSLKEVRQGPRRVDPALTVRARPPIPVAVIVATSFQEGTRWEPQVLEGARGALAVVDNIIMAREQPQRALAAARIIGGGSITLSGARPDAGEVAPLLLAAVDELIAGTFPAVSSEQVGDVVQRVRVDRWTGEIVQALADAGVHPILLRGPAIVHWLYADEPYRRSYADADLLVAPSDHVVAREALVGCGFELASEPRLAADRDQGLSCFRKRDGATIDLHESLHGMADVPTERIWAAALEDAESLTVDGVTVAVLGPAMRLLHVTLHLTARDGPGDRAWTDLSRALEISTPLEWEAAFALARWLEVTHELAARLRRRPDATALLERLGPQRNASQASCRRERTAISRQ